MNYDEKQNLINAIKTLESFINDMPFVFKCRNEQFNELEKEALLSINKLKSMAVKEFGLTI